MFVKIKNPGELLNHLGKYVKVASSPEQESEAVQIVKVENKMAYVQPEGEEEPVPVNDQLFKNAEELQKSFYLWAAPGNPNDLNQEEPKDDNSNTGPQDGENASIAASNTELSGQDAEQTGVDAAITSEPATVPSTVPTEEAELSVQAEVAQPLTTETQGN